MGIEYRTVLPPAIMLHRKHLRVFSFAGKIQTEASWETRAAGAVRAASLKSAARVESNDGTTKEHKANRSRSGQAHLDWRRGAYPLSTLRESVSGANRGAGCYEVLRSMSPVVRISELQADYQDTERSTAQTVAAMGAHVQAALKDPLVLATARACLDADFRPGRLRIAGQVWAWVKQNVRFVTDEDLLLKLLGRQDELELLISPGVLLWARVKAGDCDDFTMLCCAMLAALGVPPLIKTYKCDRTEPNRWSHVCAAAILEDGSIFPVDASHGTYAGWEVPASDVYQSALWDMNGNRVGGGMGRTRSRGLSGYTPAPGWTGNEVTTVSGPYAGPYPGGDFTRMYGGRRWQGLNAIARGKYRGMGDDSTTTASGFDVSTLALPDSGQPALPANTSDFFTDLGDDFSSLFSPAAGGVSTTSTTGFNLSNFLGQLTGSAASVAAAALATPGAVQRADGSILLPNGTVVPAASSGVSSSTILLLGGLLFVMVLMSSKK